MNDIVTQTENEPGRLTVAGRRTDNGERCSLLVVHERRGDWLFYPHGAARLGVRVVAGDAVTVAEAILGGAR